MRSSWTGVGLRAVLCSLIVSACGEGAPTEPNAAAAPAIPVPTYAAAKGPNGESRYLVQFKTAEGADFEKKVKALGGKVTRRDKEIATLLVTGLKSSALATLRARSDVEVVSSDLQATAVIESNLGGNQSPAKLEQCLEDNADPIGSSVFFGAGRINVLAEAVCQLTL